jgi:hypothetical protein
MVTAASVAADYKLLHRRPLLRTAVESGNPIT